MQEEIRQIAARIKEIREIAGVSLESLAGELQVPREIYQQYERGDIDIPVGILHKLSQRFGIALSALITGEEPRLRTYDLTRKGKGISVERHKDYDYQSLAYNFVHRKLEPFLVTAAPEEAGKPLNYNSHPGQEFHYVLEGTLRLVLGDRELALEEGDSILFDASVAHAVQAIGNKTVKFLAVIY